MKRIISSLLLSILFCVSVSTADDDCAVLAKTVANALPNEPFVVKVVFCEMLLNRVESEEFPNDLPSVCRSVVSGGGVRTPSDDDLKAARIAMSGYDFGCGSLNFEKCDKVKRTPPEKRGGVRLYGYYFY